MKKILAIAAAFTLAASASQAQTAGAGAVAGSTAQSGASAGSQSGAVSAVILNQNTPSKQRIVTAQDGYQEIRNTPSVTAPAVFGGGHPCLAGKSGGVAVAGFGGSYGQGNPEPACMAWVMGQPEVAIRIMMSTSPEFCRAMNNVGYYRVGNAVVPVACGKQVVKGGVDTPGVTSTTTRVSTRSQSNILPQAVCNKQGGKLKYSIDAHFANKDSARANCKNRLR